MAKFLYTISHHARVIIDDAGTLPINVVHWLGYKKFFDCHEIEFCQSLFSLIGYKCKLEIEYVCELLDSRSSVVFAASASSADKAQKMLFHIIPINYTTSLKNPKHSDDARNVIAKYQANETLSMERTE